MGNEIVPVENGLPDALKSNVMQKIIDTASTLEFIDEEEKIIYAPVDETTVEIRPDGMIYLPWIEYQERLRRAFHTKFAFVQIGEIQKNDNQIYIELVLMIKGKFAGRAIGEQDYQPDNRTMTYADAIEGAKSNARMRCCKDIGMFSDLWRPSFIRAWKEKYSVAVWCEGAGTNNKGKSKLLWRKKDAPKFDYPWREQGSGKSPGGENIADGEIVGDKKGTQTEQKKPATPPQTQRPTQEQKKPEPPKPEKGKLTPAQQKLSDLLKTCCAGEIEMQEQLKLLTVWTNRNGVEIEGRTSFNGMSDTMANIARRKLEGIIAANKKVHEPEPGEAQ